MTMSSMDILPSKSKSTLIRMAMLSSDNMGRPNLNVSSLFYPQPVMDDHYPMHPLHPGGI
jgi:hypothetical protein